MGGIEFAGGCFHLGQGDVQIGVNMHDLGFELLAARKNGDQSFLPARKMGVCGDDSGTSDEETRTGFVQPFQVNDGGLGLAHKLFER